jgi:VWFA-related protein
VLFPFQPACDAALSLSAHRYHDSIVMRLAVIGFACAMLSSAQETPAFRSDVSLVHLDAEVGDGSRTLTGFNKEDFVVKDSGAPQSILYFSRDEDPLDLILLFDVSGSMKTSVERVAASAHTALAELRSGDRVAVMVFSGHSRLVAPFSEHFGEVENAVNEVVMGKFGGSTHLLAAVDDAAKYFLAQPGIHRRRAVLILTDNYGQRSRRASTVIHDLWEADASLSGLIIRSGVDVALNTSAMVMNPALGLLHEGMGGVADQTGGDTLKADDPGDAFQEMMRRIRQRYSLYYAMPLGKPGQARQVKVDLTAEARGRFPNARVRARKGYVTPPKS